MCWAARRPRHVHASRSAGAAGPGVFTLGTLQEAHLAFGMFLRRYEEDMAETGRLPDWKCSDTSDEAESMFGMFPRPYDEDVVLTYRLCCTEQQGVTEHLERTPSEWASATGRGGEPGDRTGTSPRLHGGANPPQPQLRTTRHSHLSTRHARALVSVSVNRGSGAALCVCMMLDD